MDTESKPLRKKSPEGLLAVTAADSPSLTLIEVHGALGVLLAKRGAAELLSEVIYFRLVAGTPHGKYFDTVEVQRREIYYVCSPNGSDTLLYEPSIAPYHSIKIGDILHELLTEAIIDRNVPYVRDTVHDQFSSHARFSICTNNGELQGPSDYASGLPDFIDDTIFFEPPSRPNP